MGIKSKSNPSAPLFHCVDMDWQQDGFIFQFSAQLTDEAETVLNVLLPLLMHKYPDADVGSNFTGEAEERCESMFWNEEKQMIVDTAYDQETAIFEE